MRVALLIVSHSAKLADGVVELAGQMAPDVTILAAGGMDDGGLGTSLGKIGAAICKFLGFTGDYEWVTRLPN